MVVDQAVGVVDVAKMWLKKIVSSGMRGLQVVGGPRELTGGAAYLRSSAGRPSAPHALPFFSWYMALRTSASVNSMFNGLSGQSVVLPRVAGVGGVGEWGSGVGNVVLVLWGGRGWVRCGEEGCVGWGVEVGCGD
jgi:hypothetical protein